MKTVTPRIVSIDDPDTGIADVWDYKLHVEEMRLIYRRGATRSYVWALFAFILAILLVALDFTALAVVFGGIAAHLDRQSADNVLALTVLEEQWPLALLINRQASDIKALLARVNPENIPT